MSDIKTKLGKGGRVVIPAKYRKALGVKPGDDLVLVLEGDMIRILTPRQAVRTAQALVRRHIPKTRSLVRELLQERREEVARG